MKKRRRIFLFALLYVSVVLLCVACRPAADGEPALREEVDATAVPTTPPTPEPDAGAETAVPTPPSAVTLQATAETAVPTPLSTPTLDVTVTAEATTIIAPNGAIILTEDTRSDRLRAFTSHWQTNWERRIVSYDEIFYGGVPRDGIPSIDAPLFVNSQEAGEWLADNEPVVAFVHNGDARAYPLQILTWHEIVNDKVGNLPVAITFCPLCNSAIVFNRRLDETVYQFGVSGLLRNSDLIMYDRTTETLWQQFTGEGLVGDLAGYQLTFLPSAIVSFADFRAAHPGGLVLSRDTGFSRRYGENPYVGYDAIGQNPFLYDGPVDGRLPAMARVVTVNLPGEGLDLAYPLTILAEVGVINDRQAGQDLVVFHTPGTSSALDARDIAAGADVGATGVFDPNLNGRKLTFAREGDRIVDAQTGSAWNIFGQAVSGPLAGEALTRIVHADHFWFSWAAFRPDTLIYGG
jgi:hypothetical protein